MRMLSIAFPWFAGTALLLAGSEQILKQKAKDIRDQNVVRQSATPAAPASTTRPTAATHAMPAQTPLARLTTDLTNIKTNSTVTSAQIQAFARDLASAAQGQRKPSTPALTKLATDLLPSLTTHPLSANSRSRLLQNVMAVVNAGGLTQTQLNDVIADIQDLLKANGIPAATAKTVADDARALAREVTPSAS